MVVTEIWRKGQSLKARAVFKDNETELSQKSGIVADEVAFKVRKIPEYLQEEVNFVSEESKWL